MDDKIIENQPDTQAHEDTVHGEKPRDPRKTSWVKQHNERAAKARTEMPKPDTSDQEALDAAMAKDALAGGEFTVEIPGVTPEEWAKLGRAEKARLMKENYPLRSTHDWPENLPEDQRRLLEELTEPKPWERSKQSIMMSIPSDEYTDQIIRAYKQGLTDGSEK